MLEINSSPDRRDLNELNARAAAAVGVPIVINCDAHRVGGFEVARYGIATARRAWLTTGRGGQHASLGRAGGVQAAPPMRRLAGLALAPGGLRLERGAAHAHRAQLGIRARRHDSVALHMRRPRRLAAADLVRRAQRRHAAVTGDDRHGTLPGGSFIHWQLSGLSPRSTGLAAGAQPAVGNAGHQQLRDHRLPRPVPAPRGAAHHYVITISALGSGQSLWLPGH